MAKRPNIQRCAESAPDYTLEQLISMVAVVEYLLAFEPTTEFEGWLVAWVKRIVASEAPLVEPKVLTHYTATYGDDGLVVEFYATSQECDAAMDALERQHKAGDIDTYTGGAIS